MQLGEEGELRIFTYEFTKLRIAYKPTLALLTPDHMTSETQPYVCHLLIE